MPDRLSDRCTPAGAAELAEKIVDYWRARGFPLIKAWVDDVARFSNASIYGVRSNILPNGFPPRV